VSENGDKRPLLAAALAVLYPGLGHLYLGLWWRAVVWSGMAGLALATAVPDEAFGLVRDSGPAALAAALWGTSALVLATVATMAAVDAYWHATRGTAGGGDAAATCPECGKDVDDDLSFCQWCTAELE